MTVWVCKTCGRALKAAQKPNYCYADLTTSIENISDEDSIKMGLFKFPEKAKEIFFGEKMIIEFPGDFKYNPVLGEIAFPYTGYTLSELQDSIMKQLKGE